MLLERNGKLSVKVEIFMIVIRPGRKFTITAHQ